MLIGFFFCFKFPGYFNNRGQQIMGRFGFSQQDNGGIGYFPIDGYFGFIQKCSVIPFIYLSMIAGIPAFLFELFAGN
jgi:hypothetical protein